MAYDTDIAQPSGVSAFRLESQRKMAQVLRVARAMFVERGFRGTTMGDIASAAGVSKRTLYLWHEDKNALFLACLDLGARLFPQAVTLDGEDLHESLRRYAVSVLEQASEASSIGIGRLLTREQYDFPEIQGMAARTQDRYLIQPLAQWLRGRGLEAQGSAEMATLFLSMTLAPVHDRLLIGSDPLDAGAIDRHARLVVGVFLDGVQPETGRATFTAAASRSHRTR